MVIYSYTHKYLHINALYCCLLLLLPNHLRYRNFMHSYRHRDVLTTYMYIYIYIYLCTVLLDTQADVIVVNVKRLIIAIHCEL